MQNPLTSLDELIWKEFEKITQYAHKNYGWDKYDLATLTHLSCSIAMAGMCTYASINEAIDHHYNTSAFTGFLIMPIAVHHQSQRKFCDNLKEIESQTLKLTGAAVKYSFNPLRASLTLASLAASVFGINYLTEAPDTKKILEGLMIILGGAGFLGMQVSNYFITQLPNFPSTKKPFWRTTYEKIANKWKPKPQLEPATEPSSQYSLTDNLTATNF